MPGPSSDWDQPQYYFPTYENDNLLCGLEDQDESGFNTSEDRAPSESSFPPVMPEVIPAPVKVLTNQNAVLHDCIGQSHSRSQYCKMMMSEDP